MPHPSPTPTPRTARTSGGEFRFLGAETTALAIRRRDQYWGRALADDSIRNAVKMWGEEQLAAYLAIYCVLPA